MNTFIFLLVLTGFTGTGINFILKNLLYICQPSEVLIFAGPKRRVSTGRTVGYRLVKGGKSLRTPLFERAFRMDLTNTIIELKVTNAYSKGGIPLFVEGIANIKVAGEEPVIHNAIERLLGKNRKEVEQIARETLEGNLRGVLASLTPQQVNEDKMAFARSLLEEATDDLEKLGLTLDNLQIQNIWDEVGYLDSIGRKQQAELQRDARIAEAQNKATSIVKRAENDRNTALRRIESNVAITEARAEQRIQNALTQREAMIAEAQSIVESEVARTEAEIAVQQARIKQVEQQLLADVITPAEASCKRSLSEAKGAAAKIIEEGKARAEGIQELAASWHSSGENAREVFLFQKLDTLLKTLVATVPKVQVDNLTLVDTHSGNLATQLAAFSEQMRQATGIDLPGMVNRLGKTSSVYPTPTVSAPIPPTPRPAPTPVPAPLPPVRTIVETMPVVKPAPASAPAPEGIQEDEDFDDFEALEVTVPPVAPSLEDPPLPTKPRGLGLEDLKRRMEDQLDRLVLAGATIPQAEASLHKTIRQNQDLRRQLQRALQVGGRETLDQIFKHPLIRISGETIEAWLQDE